MNIHADINYTVHQIHVQFVSSVLKQELVLDLVLIDLTGVQVNTEYKQ